MSAYEVFKWLKSENCSSEESKRLATKTRKAFGMTPKQYRKMLSQGREKTKVLERLMSEGRWDEIQFDSVPSKAGLMYKKAFARRDITRERYEAFAKDEDTKVNAGTLYPYEVVAKALGTHGLFGHKRDKEDLSETDRLMIEKYWNNLPDYLHGKECKILCVVDTSASMTWFGGAAAPINIAIALGMYCAERISGPFKNTYISFSRRPQVIKIEGIDFVDKVRRIEATNLCENTDLIAAFELIRNIALQSNPEDMPDNIVVISDMEIDDGCKYFCGRDNGNKKLVTDMERERELWQECGLQMPKLTYWNCQSRQKDNILDLSDNVSYVSGFSPVLFESILSGKTGWSLCLDKLLSERYEAIQ